MGEADTEDKLRKRWIRIIRGVVGVSTATGGFKSVTVTRERKIEGSLAERVERWAAEDRVQEEEEARKLLRADDEAMQAYGGEGDEGDGLESQEAKGIKVCNRIVLVYKLDLTSFLYPLLNSNRKLVVDTCWEGSKSTTMSSHHLLRIRTHPRTT